MLSSIRPHYFRQSHGNEALLRLPQNEIADSKLLGLITHSRNRRRKGLKPSTMVCDSEARKKRKDPNYEMKSRQRKQKNLTQLELSALQAAE